MAKRHRTIEQITGITNPDEIPHYEETKLMLTRVHKTAKLLIDDAARNQHYLTWADYCKSLAKTDGTRWFFNRLAAYFRKEATKYSPQLTFDRLKKTNT